MTIGAPVAFKPVVALELIRASRIVIVAAPANQCAMGPFKREVGCRMIEQDGIEHGDLRFWAAMLCMTRGADALFQPAVKSGGTIEIARDFLVAGKAMRRLILAYEVRVARIAVTLQRCVCRVQLAG